MNDFEIQDGRVYQWLMEGNSITTLDAMLKLGIGCLTKRISTLIQVYHVPIHKERVKNINNRGNHIRYSIIKENRAILKGVSMYSASHFDKEVLWQRGSEPSDLYNINRYEDDRRKDENF